MTLLPIRGLYEKTTPAFRRKLSRIAKGLGMDPNHIAAVMACESGFDPAIRNPDSRSTGLIQFMPGTAKLLGTSIDELAEMTAEEQLDYVGKYYGRFPWHEKLKTPTQVYMATFTGEPFHPPDHVIFEWPSTAYLQNKGFDINGDGVIQVFEVGSFPERLIKRAQERAATNGPPARESTKDSSGVLPLLFVGALGLAVLKGARRYG